MSEDKVMGAQSLKLEAPGVSGQKLDMRTEVPQQKGGNFIG